MKDSGNSNIFGFFDPDPGGRCSAILTLAFFQMGWFNQPVNNKTTTKQTCQENLVDTWRGVDLGVLNAMVCLVFLLGLKFH